ncbi:MAG: hypothetical protein R3F14_22190 [Polyangiaceae bacterium]
MKHDVAKQVLAIAQRVTTEMDASISLVQNECSDEEFAEYRKAAGRVMGYLFADIVRPILQEHPDLVPEEMKHGKKG